MSLWRRPSGIYESHVMIDGVRYRKSTGTSNRRLAERIDRKNQEELMARRFQVEEHEFDPGMKFAELYSHIELPILREAIEKLSGRVWKRLCPHDFCLNSTNTVVHDD